MPPKVPTLENWTGEWNKRYSTVQLKLFRSGSMMLWYNIGKIYEKGGDETRNIKHFYFLSWPDHGVPKDTGGYLSFYNRIQTSIARLTTPLVVHCSAGVGRTGTFIAMDYLVKQAADQNRLQFYECVEKMRMRRPHMIQTVEQYRFLYTAVCEFLSTKDFTYSPDRLATLIRDLGEEDESNIYREYKLLQRRVDSVQLQYSKAKLSMNREKNRFAECLAADGHRVYINGSGFSDYINAVFMDTYKEKNHWIATQLPLKNSLEDFWTMVVEQDVKIIVQLEHFVKEEAFFPSEGDHYELVFGKFTIARLNDDQTGDVAEVIALKVSTKQAEHTVSVVVASKVWEGQSEPDASDLIKLHDLIEKLEQMSGNGTTILTCLNGASRCGIMICLYNALDKLKLEQQVDVYCPVLKARLRRPQFIASIAQYALIYDALKEYVEQFSDYGNFK